MSKIKIYLFLLLLGLDFYGCIKIVNYIRKLVMYIYILVLKVFFIVFLIDIF